MKLKQLITIAIALSAGVAMADIWSENFNSGVTLNASGLTDDGISYVPFNYSQNKWVQEDADIYFSKLRVTTSNKGEGRTAAIALSASLFNGVADTYTLNFDIFSINAGAYANVSIWDAAATGTGKWGSYGIETSTGTQSPWAVGDMGLISGGNPAIVPTELARVNYSDNKAGSQSIDFIYDGSGDVVLLFSAKSSVAASKAVQFDNLRVIPPAPAAPTGLTAVEGPAGTVTLSWTDNSANEDGYTIQQDIGGSWTTIHTTAADVESYSVEGLSAGTDYNFRVQAYNTGGNSVWTYANITTTSSGVDVRAYQTAEGVVVEFVAYDVEADGTIKLVLMGANGEVVWQGSVDVTAGPQFFARFPVPGLELGQTYDFQVRDEVGKWWDADGVTVESFAAKMTSASLAGITIAFDSLPGREYEILWAAELGAEWVVVETVTASASKTSAVVAHPDPEDTSGFFSVRLK